MRQKKILIYLINKIWYAYIRDAIKNQETEVSIHAITQVEPHAKWEKTYEILFVSDG